MPLSRQVLSYLPPGSRRGERLPKGSGTVQNETQILSWEHVEEVIRGSRLTILYGPPGTGKTTAAVNAAAALGRTVYNVTLTDETPAAELRGHFIPRGSDWTWMDGPALSAFRDGGVLILNEIDKGSLDTLDFLHGLLDDDKMAAMTLPSGERVAAHAEFTCVATTNRTPQDLPEAIKDRLAAAMYIGAPHPDAIASLPDDLQDAARNSAGNDQDPDRPATLRRWKVFASLRDTVGPDVAAAAVFGHRAQEILDALTLGEAR